MGVEGVSKGELRSTGAGYERQRSCHGRPHNGFSRKQKQNFHAIKQPPLEEFQIDTSTHVIFSTISLEPPSENTEKTFQLWMDRRKCGTQVSCSISQS